METGSESLAGSTLAALKAFEKEASLSPTGGPRPIMHCPERLQSWAGDEAIKMTCRIEVSAKDLPCGLPLTFKPMVFKLLHVAAH